MNRFHLPPAACHERPLSLTGDQAHHALRVLRLRVGDPIVVLDGEGTELACAISALQRHSVALEVLQQQTHPRPAGQITLIQAVPKGKAIDLIIQKATELGAHRIIPLLTERTEVHLDALQADKKLRKWESIMVESIKQCGNPWLPLLDLPTPLSRLLQTPQHFELSLVASLSPARAHPHFTFQHHLATTGRSPQTLALWIGPEGDFSPEEHEAILQTGARPISLGDLVLRADTAAIAGLAVLRHELGVTDQSATPRD